MIKEIEKIISLTGGLNVEVEDEWESNEQVLDGGKESQISGGGTKMKTAREEKGGGSQDSYEGKISLGENISKVKSTLNTLKVSEENGDKRNTGDVDPSLNKGGHVDNVNLSHLNIGEVDGLERLVVEMREVEGKRANREIEIANAIMVQEFRIPKVGEGFAEGWNKEKKRTGNGAKGRKIKFVKELARDRAQQLGTNLGEAYQVCTKDGVLGMAETDISGSEDLSALSVEDGAADLEAQGRRSK
uniref:Uncharacterized protein n=1 Tax=Cannabis sativa TaxID=3483 RepID=A0A803P2V5_CANSA